MKKLVRCKACGYIGPEGSAWDVCPACGVARKMLEPYEHPVSEGRRTLLELHIHPIVVHFPVAFAVAGLAVALFAIVFPQVYRASASAVLKAVVLALPFAAAASIATGMLDGKTRFRRLRAPFLRYKIVLGGAYFLLSLVAVLVTFLVGPGAPWVRIVDAVLLAGCVACAAVLGRIGGKLLYALFPG
jgi:uncharacterized membrane protein